MEQNIQAEKSNVEEVGNLFPLFTSPSKFQPNKNSTKKAKKTPKRKYSDETEEKSNKARPRTPSGQVLSSSVEDIKSQLRRVIDGNEILQSKHDEGRETNLSARRHSTGNVVRTSEVDQSANGIIGDLSGPLNCLFDDSVNANLQSAD